MDVDGDTDTETLTSLFAAATATTSANGKDTLETDVLNVLESLLRLYTITPQELFYKWESYCLKMTGSGGGGGGGIGGGVGRPGQEDDIKLDLNTARMFQKDVRDGFEKGYQQQQQHHHHQKTGGRGLEKKQKNNIAGHTAGAVMATPKSTGGSADVFGMLDELTPNTVGRRSVISNGSVKRKADFESPIPKKYSRPDPSKKVAGNSDAAGMLAGIPFSDRTNAGQVIESINSHLPQVTAPIAPYAEARIKPIANTDVKKFGYKPMAMRLSDSSEILDERIDEFMALIQKHHGLDDSAFGNAAAQSTNEIVAVGRIASDTLEGKLNAASTVLEMSRRMGAGLRVTLKLDGLSTYSLFPGQIIAVRGTNASGQYFTATEILSIPKLPMPVSPPSAIEVVNSRLGIDEETTSAATSNPLNILFASGPYTADDNLAFEPLQALCERATSESVDAVILTGPFIDIEHPLLASGDFDLPAGVQNIHPETMTTLFRLWITPHLERLCHHNPTTTVILVPSVRDALSKHVSWPQEQLSRSGLGLPKSVKMLPNPCFLSLNETVFAISSQDVLYQLSREQIRHGEKEDLLTRLLGLVIEQRHFFPLFPATSRGTTGEKNTTAGACLDLGYLKLGEWLNVRPDVLVLPSVLTPSVKVVDSVMVVNPGSLSKKKGAGTFSQMALQPRIIKEEERSLKNVSHNVFDRARVDVVRI